MIEVVMFFCPGGGYNCMVLPYKEKCAGGN